MTTNTTIRHAMLAALATLTTASGLASGQPVTVLDSIAGGVYSRAEDINDLWQVVGTSYNGVGVEATVWNNGAASGLGMVKGTDHSYGMAINNSGEVVGSSETGVNPGEPGNVKTATHWGPDGATDLGGSLGLAYSAAYDINSTGTVAMQGERRGGGTTGYAWSSAFGGTQADGDAVYAFGANFGINDSNTLVGYAAAGTDGQQAIHAGFNGSGWDVGAEIGPQGVRDPAAAEAISNTGLIVGQAGDGRDHIFEAVMFTLDSKNPVEWLGKLAGFDDSSAHDVNDNGLVVGHSTLFGEFGVDQRAVAWVNGEIFDLNNLLGERSGFQVLISATGVNNHGDIVGYGILDNGDVGAFVINGYVPAPGAALTLLGGLAAASRRRRG